MSVSDESFEDWIDQRCQVVHERLRDAVRTPYFFVDEVAHYLIEAGGKMYRPALVFAAGALGDPGEIDQEGLVSAAVVVELTHVASLYHDDVMDEAELRRGGITAHKKWGNSVAIMVGDYLLAQSSRVGATLGVEFMTHQSITLARLVQGQILEMRGPAPGADRLAHHLDAVSHKTAALIAAAAHYGAYFAHLGPSRTESLTQYGENLGMAFQLADDLLDILSQDSGKQLGTDLREGVPTLTTLLVQRQQRPQDARLLELLAGPVADQDIDEALALLRSHPAVDEARAQIRAWAGAAKAHLAGFADSPALHTLALLCDEAVSRGS